MLIVITSYSIHYTKLYETVPDDGASASDDLRIVHRGEWPGFAGIDGEIRAGAGAGTLSFSSGTVSYNFV